LPEDLDTLVSFREQARDYIRELPDTGDMWEDWYPDKPTAVKSWGADIEAGDVIAVRDDIGELVESVTLKENANPMLWTKLERREALFVSRLVRKLPPQGAVDEHKGIGKSLLAWSEEEAARRGKRFVRLDVWAKNKPLQKQYEESWGYTPLPSTMWHSYPSYILFEKEVLGASDARQIHSYGGLDILGIHNREIRDPFDAFPALTPTLYSKWRDGTLYNWYRPNQRKPKLFATSMDGGFLVAPAQAGGPLIRTRISKSPGTLNANVCDLLTDEMRSSLSQTLGLAQFLVEERVESRSNYRRPMGNQFTRHVYIHALEKPAEDVQAYKEAYTRYRAEQFDGEGVLVKGTFNDGRLDIDGMSFTLQTPLSDTNHASTDIVTTRCLRPPSPDEFGMQALDPQTLQNGDLLMARLAVPPVEPGEVSHIQATLLRIAGRMPAQTHAHLAKLMLNTDGKVVAANISINEQDLEAR
jgi:hypothetical protein